jgi:hypothetical protein
MAITSVYVSRPTNILVFQDTSMGNAVDGIKASSALVYEVTVDNSANSGAASYVKLFNHANGSVTLGTTAPDEVIYVPAAAVVTRLFFTGAVLGVTFGTALSAACVTTGGTAGTTSPASPVIVSVSFV